MVDSFAAKPELQSPLLSATVTLGATHAGTIPKKTVVFRLWAVFFCVIAFMYTWLAEGLAGGYGERL